MRQSIKRWSVLVAALGLSLGLWWGAICLPLRDALLHAAGEEAPGPSVVARPESEVPAPFFRFAWGGTAFLLALGALSWRVLRRADRSLKAEEAMSARRADEKNVLETKLRTARRAMRDIRAWNGRMLASVTEGVLAVDAEGRITWCNAAALRRLGYDRESELLGRDAHQLLCLSHPDGSAFDRADCPLCSGLARGEAASVPRVNLRRRDGASFLASAHMAPVCEDGLPRGGVLTFLDVTDLHAHEALLRTVFNASVDAYLIFGDDLTPLDANGAALRLFRAADIAALRDGAWPAALQTDGRPAESLLREALRAALEAGEARLELNLNDDEGRPLPCETTLVRVDLGGRRVVFVTLRDVRALRGMEDALRRESRYLQMLLDASPLGVIIASGEQRRGGEDAVRWVNPRATELTGLAVGDELAPVFVHPDDYALIRGELVKNGVVREHATQVCAPSGEIRHVFLTALPMSFEGEPALLLWIADITPLKATEQALRTARDAAEAATRAKSDFLARMSHEIRTPMNAILGMGYLCLQTKLEPKQKDYLNKIQDAAHSLLSIINDILDFSKVDNDALALEKAPFRLNALLESVSAAMAPKAEGKNLEFLVSIEPHMPNLLVGDSLRLAQVLQVLVGNAIKFTEQGEVMVRVASESANGPLLQVHFSVSDTGIGLNEEEQERLFLPFTQADGSSTRRFGGTGLGLAISKRIVDLMGGSIWVESRPHEGSVFHFVVPLEAQPGAPATPWSPALGFSELSALVVDDNAAALRVIGEQVGSLGFRVTTAGSGREALELLERARNRGLRYRFLILDWRMPDLDGLETAHLAQNLFSPREAPAVILVSAAVMDFEHDVLAENGIRACLTKPVSIPLLRDTCARLLEEDAARGDETRREDKTDAGPGESVTGARVLLVEDNDINQEIARSLFEEAGVDVDVARNGAEAVRMVERADEGAYRMVFMDIQMPVMDGLEAARRIRAQGHEPEDLPIVAMTAHAQSSDREKSLQAGMNDHLVKPLDPEEVRRSLRAWIKNAPALPRDGGARPATGRRDAPEERRNGSADVDTRDIPGLSQAAGLESVGGNRVLYAKLLRRFQISCRDTVRDIHRALELADEELAVRLAHTVKGVSASLGFMALSRAAAVTEKALKDKEPEFTLEKTLLPVFGDELERALAAVDIYLEALPAAEAADNLGAVCELPRRELTADESAGAADLLGKLVANLEADWGAVMDGLEHLTPLLECTDYAPRLSELVGHVEGFDIPQARAVARKMAEGLKISAATVNK